MKNEKPNSQKNYSRDDPTVLDGIYVPDRGVCVCVCVCV